ncbi:soluble cytochrome b562 [Formivibrio citricus]|uniref:Soluble cytochrome b562 n=1 Tax=Formivibrio citricus TaxID=83765 RepID=A0A1I4XGQ0_9NEIS|nr:cytochrome b562 [Formivibrio citricus]SFN24862.1 soluble cytochrome b562 [Formivibrio citricus]
MKKFVPLICAAILSLGFASQVQAEVSVKAEMKAMGQSFKAADSAKDAATLKKELVTVRDLAKKTQAQVLASRQQGKPEQTYLEGIGKLLAALDNSIALADAGKFDAAKASLARAKELRSEYHKKMRD